MKRSSFWAWVTFAVGAAYFLIPLIATFEFSLRMRRGEYSFEAYRVVFGDPNFQASFTYSALIAVAAIIVGVLIVVPTAYIVQLKLPRLRPLVEFITLLPLVIPAIVLVFGYIRMYNSSSWIPLTNSARGTDFLLTCAYVDVLWRVAEAFANTDRVPRAKDAYIYVLTNCDDPAERLATMQKAIDVLPEADIPGSGNNFTSYSNPRVTELMKQALQVPGCAVAERAKLYQEIQAIMADDLPYLWLYVINGWYGARTGVGNFTPLPNQQYWNVEQWTIEAN